jgi:dienelactone hydrolase
MAMSTPGAVHERPVHIPVGTASIAADVSLPVAPRGVILFAHGSGSSRLSPRNRHVARSLNAAGLATVLADLLTLEEEAVDERTRQFRFDIDLLAQRLLSATDWLAEQPDTLALPVGYFGASTGAAAALVAAAQRPAVLRAVVSRGGRPDLAGDALGHVEAPTLLLVGGDDGAVIDLNRRALGKLQCVKELAIVPGATHLFEEPGALDIVASRAGAWFRRYLASGAAAGDQARRI